MASVNLLIRCLAVNLECHRADLGIRTHPLAGRGDEAGPDPNDPHTVKPVKLNRPGIDVQSLDPAVQQITLLATSSKYLHNCTSRYTGRRTVRNCITMCRACCRILSGPRLRHAGAVAITGLLVVLGARAQPFSARVTFGYGEDPPARWTGSIRADGARIDGLEGWLFGSQDRIELDTFELHTRNPARTEPALKGLVVRGTSTPGAGLTVSSDRGESPFASTSWGPELRWSSSTGWSVSRACPALNG